MLRAKTWRRRENNDIHTAFDDVFISIEADEGAFVGDLTAVFQSFLQMLSGTL